ncbi:MAG: hypothetical protein ACKVX9_21575 [Blastocatellia bacterium]
MNWNLFLPRFAHSVGAIAVSLSLLSAQPALSSPSPPAWPSYCACCADPGVWSLETGKMDNGVMKELNRLKPGGIAAFYVTDAWPDDISGVAASDMGESGQLVVSIVREQRNWKFFLKTSKGETGVLVLTIPGTAAFFHADIERHQKPENKPPTTVYKEVRLEGEAVRGTGIFAKGIMPKTKFRLVLQGEGNMCLNAEDFHRWNLRISGPKAAYTIYGFFDKPSA